MNQLLRTFSVFASLSFATFASAQHSDQHSLAFGAEAGTTGLGASVWLTASSRLVVTAGYGSLTGDHDYSTNGVDYNGSVDLSNGYALVRWHPFAGHFHLSTGAVLTENTITVTGRPQDGTTYDIDGVQYPAEIVGSIVGDVKWDKSLVPYFGLGWSKQPLEGGWGAFLDLGVIQSGSADATLSATGTAASDPTFQDHLRAEEQDVNNELDSYELFPVARIGVLYRF